MNELFYSASLFARIRVIRGCLICLLFAFSPELKAAEIPSYKGLMRIPIDLMTADGVRLEKGQYGLEVKPEAKGYVLCFSSGSQTRAVVRPVPSSDTTLSSALSPVVGTHYLRPSTEPLLTGEERRFSKTGRTQYEEEIREWRATLRVYKASGDTVLFVFQSKGLHGQWNRVTFKLSRP
jgi:hypothetical protein